MFTVDLLSLFLLPLFSNLCRFVAFLLLGTFIVSFGLRLVLAGFCGL